MDTSGNGVAGAAGSAVGDRRVTPTGAAWTGSTP